MPSVAEEQPRGLLPGRKRRRDNSDVDSPQSSLYDLAMPKSSHQQQANHGISSRQQSLCHHHHYPQHHQPLQQQQQQQQQSVHNHYHHQHNLLDYHKVPLAAFEQHVNRKMAPLPTTKRQRVFEGDHDVGNDHIHIHGSPRPRKLSRSPSSSYAATPARPQLAQRTNSNALLEPCHICRRKPTKKSDLDSFGECQGCLARTCFVCLRECQGWISEQQQQHQQQEPQQEQREQQCVSDNEDDACDPSEQEALSRSFHMEDADAEVRSTENGSWGGDATSHGSNKDLRSDAASWASGGHRQVVCSQCCIEKGAEGDVVCLGCLSRMK